ncbi:hypothetical protein [Amycolatopsis plumensis]|uniref:Uncharacterized protein n=1 Tax=Amycolatopsis plumensis TaxID=236508 RepID=A0ABV5U0Y3_9PSEU
MPETETRRITRGDAAALLGGLVSGAFEVSGPDVLEQIVLI